MIKRQRKYSPRRIATKITHQKDFRTNADELNDCTVHALMHSTGLSYDDSYEMARRAGRKFRKGLHSYKLIKVFNETNTLGLAFRKIQTTIWTKGRDDYDTFKDLTLKGFIKRNPIGRFYVSVDCHAICIHDGVVIDGKQWGSNKRVHQAWRLEVKENVPAAHSLVLEERLAALSHD